MSTNTSSPPWRHAVRLFLIAILAVAAVSVLLDGARPALAAGECQYGPYGPYGSCPKAKPTLRLLVPATTGIGTTAFPSAVIENGDTPTGLLIVRLHRPGEECANPSQPPAWLGQANVNGNGTYFAGSPFGLLPFLDRFGTWKWSATYTGDARNDLVSTVCGAYTTEVTKQTPAFFISRPSSATVGGAATVFGSVFLFQPVAPVTLRVFDPGDPTCSGVPAFTRSVFAPSFVETFGPLGKVGTWRIVASYPGDANNNAATTACSAFPIEVTKASVFLSPFVSSSMVTVGQTVSAGFGLSGAAPTGTMTVRVFGPTDPTCSAAVQTRVFDVVGNGTYAVSLTPTRVGTWQLTASYSGDDANIASVAACGLHRIEVAKVAPTLELVAVPTTATARDVLTARATLEGAFRPAGSVRFRMFGPEDPACTGAPAHVQDAALVDGVAVTTGFEVPKDQSGTWNWTATYEGDDNNAAAATVCGRAPVVVDKPGTDPQRGMFRFASNTDWQAYSGYPAAVSGGPPPTAYGHAQKVCLSAAGCPPDATDYGSPFGGAWTSNLSSIPGAAWIWRPGVTGATPNADFDQAVFSTEVVVAGRATEGWIEIAADDFAEVRVNGELVGSIGQAGPAYGSLTRFELTPFLKPGTNTISVLARNGPWCGTCPFSQNPAGVVFGGAVTVG